MPKVKFIHAESLVKFSKEAQEMLDQGWDFYQQWPVNLGEEIGQWMIEGKSFYEYCLLIAPSAEALNRMADVHVAEGWDFYANTVMFKGELAQWMCKDTSCERFKKAVAVETKKE